MKKHSSHELGFGHIGLILAVVGVLIVGGLVAWRFLGSNKATTSDSATTSLAQKLASAKCDYDDKDLCKFFVSWKEHTTYKMTSSSTYKPTGEKQTTTFEVDGDKTHSILTGSFSSETISIGDKSYYTKTPDGTWWKQTLTQNKPSEAEADDIAPDFTEPDDQSSEDTAKTEYKRIGKEACGNLTCFKYQVLIEGDDSTTEFLWFDDKDYQVRRSTTDSPEQSSDTSFTYDNVSIKEPTTFKELGPNQYIMPGSSEPTTLPSSADYQ